MFNYDMANTNDRPKSALEIALSARIREREMALLEGEYRVRDAESKKSERNLLHTLLASLFLG